MSTEVILDIKKVPNKITFGTVVVTFITDPFNPITSRQVSTDLHGRTLDTYLKGYCLGAEYLVKVNGKIFEGDYCSYIVQPNDNIVYVSVIAGGGGGAKQIVTLVAMIALTVVAPMAGSWLAGGQFAIGGLNALSGMTFAAGLMYTTGIMLVGSLLINSILAPTTNTSGISSPELESSTYSWTGIQTSRDLNKPIPVLYGTHALGGTVINNRFYYKEDDDWLGVQLALCHGEIEKVTIDNIKVQDASFSSFIGNPEGTNGFFQYTQGTFDQPIMAGYSDSIYNNGAVSRRVTTAAPYTFTTESTNIDFFRLHFEFPKGLYTMNKQGKKSSNNVVFSVKYRKVGDTIWNTMYSSVPNYRTEYKYEEYNSDGMPISMYWSTEVLPDILETRKVLIGYSVSPTIDFTSSSSVVFKKYFEPLQSDGSIMVLPVGRYEFEVTRLTPDDVENDIYNVSDSHIRFLEEINIADINYGGIALLGIDIKATDQLSSQRPNFITTVTRKPLLINGIYKESTNPAWICYDILTNKHYGMALDNNKVNFSEFSRWADFCNGCVNNTFNVSATNLILDDSSYIHGSLIIPETSLPIGETLSLKNLDLSLCEFIGIGQVLINNVATDINMDVSNIVKIDRFYDAYSTIRPAGFYYYVRFTHPLKANSLVSYSFTSSKYETITATKLTFNGVIDTTMDVWTALQEVARVGRGQVILQGTKYSCIYDAPKTVSGLYNAANSNNVTVTYLNAADIASEIEIQYADKNIGYEMTSISIQDPSMMLAGARSNKTSLTVKGIVSEEDALIHGRYLLATSKYIRRCITLDADIESITQSVGDLIAVQTDVTQYGKGGLILSAVNNIVTLDDMIHLTIGSEYTLKIKNVNNDIIQDYNFIANVIDHNSLLSFDALGSTPVGVITFSDMLLVVHEVNGNTISTNTLVVPNGSGIGKHDRYSFGLKGSDSILCVITDISRDGELSRQITAAEYNESILDFNYDNDILQRIKPATRVKNKLSNLYMSDRLVKNDLGNVVSMLSVSWDSMVSSYYNIYIMEDGFKNYLAMGIKGNRYELAAIELLPEVTYTIYVEDANDIGVFVSGVYTILAFSALPEPIDGYTINATGDSLEFTIDYINKPLDFSHYNIYLDDILMSKQVNDTFRVPGTLNRLTYNYNIIPFDTIGNSGMYNNVTYTVPKISIQSVVYTQEKDTIKFNLSSSAPGFNLDYYEFTYDGHIGTSKDSSVSVVANWSGAREFTFTAYDVMGIASEPFSTIITVLTPAPINLSAVVDVKDILIRWDNPTVGIPIEYFEILYDGNVYKTKSTQYRIPIYWYGEKVFMIRAVNTLGAVSDYVQTSITITNGVINYITAEVIDNNVLLRWSATPGSLPIENFILYKGDTIATLEEVGEKKGTFTSVFENTAGVYTYWVAPVDSAKNVGVPVSVTTIVNQPPDYVLNVEWESTLTGTLVNGKLTSTNKIILPVNTTETIANHFISRSWSTANDQITAGYPLWIEPFTVSGSYTEIFDYGTILPSSLVSVVIDKTNIHGTPLITCNISISTDGITYIDYLDQAQVYGNNFRYVKVKLDVTGTNSALFVNNIIVKLDSKLINDAGTGSVTNAVTGTTITFNKPFIDVTSVQVTPIGNTPKIPAYDFVDVPNPTEFTVYLYDINGVPTTGNFSWSVRGY